MMIKQRRTSMLCRGAVEDVPVPDDVDDGDRWREGLYHITKL